MMLASLLLIGLVLADGIQAVPAGSTVTHPGGKAVEVTVPSYLLPGPYYDEALRKGLGFDACQPALDRCVERTVTMAGQVQDALDACVSQAHEDDQLTADLTRDLQTARTSQMTAEIRVHDLRVQRNAAWIVTGVLLTVIGVEVGVKIAD